MLSRGILREPFDRQTALPEGPSLGNVEDGSSMGPFRGFPGRGLFVQQGPHLSEYFMKNPYF
jgi:hypothetical protein